MDRRQLLALTIVLLVPVLLIASLGPAVAEGAAGHQAAVRLAQFPAPPAADQPADEGDQPAAEGDQPAAEGDQPAAEGDQPAAEGDQPAEGEEPAEEALAPVPPTFDFETDELPPHWTCFGQDAECTVARGFGQALAGQGALLMSYMPAEGNIPGVAVGPLASDPTYTALELSIKTAELSSIRVAVSEEDGSEYESYIACPADEWLDVAIALSEMNLGEQSEDENGALDAEQIAGLTLMDLCNLPGEVGRALGIKQGQQQLWLDNVLLSGAAVTPTSSVRPDGSVLVDDFDGSVVFALPIGQADMQFAAGPGGADPGALEIRYRLGGHRWVGFVRGVAHLDLAAMRAFELSLNARHRARLVAVLEERDGSKYETSIELDPEAGWSRVSLPVEQFILDPTTNDENRQVDLDQLRVIILVVDTFNASVDLTGYGGLLVSRISFR